jgi:hypothetical protein
MKTLIKLAIVALIANAAYRVGNEYLTYFKFRDAVHEAMLFGPRDEAGLRARIMDLAAGYDVPLDPEAVVIHRGERSTHVEGAYERTIEVAPNYPYPWRFAWTLDVVPSAAGGL